MRASFGIRLGIAVTLLTVGMTTASVYYFYAITCDLVRNQVTGRLKDIGYVSSFLFDETTRQQIVLLKAKIDRDTQVSESDIRNIAPGGTLSSLSPDRIRFYHSTQEFQNLTQILRKINSSSNVKITPLQSYYPQQKRFAKSNSVLTYLIITTPESPDRKILKFIASDAPEPESPDWAGNPIGNLYAPVTPLFSQAFDGEIQISNQPYTDSFYSAITAAIPIKDQTGETIAVLGIDYLVGSEQDNLRKLQLICVSIIAMSLILSIFLSWVIARQLGYPVRQLQIAAQEVRDQNYEVVLKIKRQDELGVLAKIFNEMIACIREYSTTIEEKNRLLEAHTHNLERIVQERTLALHEANQKLQELANLDGLTNLYNRRYFDRCLQTEWKRGIRSQSWLSLIICDVDHFKSYNDTYGHQAGDECLRNVAQTIQQCLKRSEDIAARYGGEEFILVLPNTSLDGALHLAEDIRLRIKALNLQHRTSQTDCCVTVSMGVASAIPQASRSWAYLLEQADKGLYQSKQAGRDRVGIYEGERWDGS